MGKIYKVGDSGTLSVYVFTDEPADRPVHVDSFTNQATASIRLTAGEARELADALGSALKALPLACCQCGAVVGESGVLEDDKATCGACYLAANDAPMVDGEVEP